MNKGKSPHRGAGSEGVKQETPPLISTRRQALHDNQREATERKILEAAESVFSAKGFAQTTIADIVAQSNLSRGAFYLYYQNKNDIFKALVLQAIHDLYDIAVPARDIALKERIRLSTRMHLERFRQHRGVLRCLFEVSTLEPELGKIHNDARARFVHRIERHLERCIDNGQCHGIDPKVTSYCLACMIGGVTYMWLCADFEPFEQHQQLEPLVNQITEFWYRTVYVDGT